MKRKAFTVEADEELSSRFSDQVIERGYTKYRAIEGAVRLWLTLTPTEQNRWIENKPVLKPESAVPSEDEIYRDLESLADLVKVIDAKIKRSESAKTQKTPRRRRRVGD